MSIATASWTFAAAVVAAVVVAAVAGWIALCRQRRADVDLQQMDGDRL